jgi:hypothetical protein
VCTWSRGPVRPSGCAVIGQRHMRPVVSLVRPVGTIAEAGFSGREGQQEELRQRLVQGSAVSSVLDTWSRQPIVTADSRRWRPTTDQEYSLVT